jgi:hypothetical protein
MNKIQATALFTGFLLVFGAVGGMDNPDQAEFFFHQLGAALLGLFLMFMAVITANLESTSDE